MLEDEDRDYVIDMTHIKDADLSLIQINARLEARNEVQKWIIRILLSLIIGAILGVAIQIVF